MRMLVQLCQTLDKVPDEVSTAVCLLTLPAASTVLTAAAITCLTSGVLACLTPTAGNRTHAICGPAGLSRAPYHMHGSGVY
jgi:hypothetical protein